MKETQVKVSFANAATATPPVRRRAVIRALASALVAAPLALGGVAYGQAAYPSKPIRLVVHFGPGTGLDLVARGLAQQLTNQMGVSVIVDNREGAGGAIGAAAVQSASPDGYTLLFASNPPFALQPTFMKSAGYDALRGFTPIAKVSSTYTAMVSGKSAPFSTFSQFAEYAKKKPGEVTYAVPGYGSVAFVDMERINQSIGLKTLGVPYKSATQALTDTIGGQINIYMTVLPATLPHITAGTLNVLAVGSPHRLESLPNIPTMAEVIKQPGFVSSLFHAVLGPAGMKPEITARLYREVATAVQAPQFRQLLEKANVLPTLGTPEELAKDLAASDDAARKMMNLLGIKPE